VVCSAPRVREEIVHPRLQSGAGVRPLNFTVSRQQDTLTRTLFVATLRRCGMRGTRRSGSRTSGTTVSTLWTRRRYSLALPLPTKMIAFATESAGSLPSAYWRRYRFPLLTLRKMTVST
jgi:hypothetical protein